MVLFIMQYSEVVPVTEEAFDPIKSYNVSSRPEKGVSLSVTTVSASQPSSKEVMYTRKEESSVVKCHQQDRSEVSNVAMLTRRGHFAIKNDAAVLLPFPGDHHSPNRLDQLIGLNVTGDYYNFNSLTEKKTAICSFEVESSCDDDQYAPCVTSTPPLQPFLQTAPANVN